MRLLPLIALPAVALVALSGCSLGARGPVVSEDRQIDAATAVVLDTSGDLMITEGEPSLVIHAAAAVLDRLTADVRNGELVLGVKPGTPGILLGRISYELTLPSLERLELNGSGDVDSEISASSLEVEISGSGNLDIDSIDATSVSLDISGSGDVEFSGRTDDFEASIDGSGDVRADDLDSARASLEIDGSGDMTVAASDTLRVSISGSGSVRYSGSPEVEQDISGSGEVARA
ncbi:MAG: hypothetical protein JWR04_3230 [Rhodoglobus sp.]|nr:hypothetical protein [Rhodoglobus sp.]